MPVVKGHTIDSSLSLRSKKKRSRSTALEKARLAKAAKHALSTQQSDQPQPGSTQQSDQPQPGSTQQSNQPLPGSTQQSNQPLPGSMQQSNQPLPGSTQQPDQAQLESTPQPHQQQPGSTPQPLPGSSASARKLRYFSKQTAQNPPSSTNSELEISTIVQLDCLSTLFNDLLCPDCLQPSLALKRTSTCSVVIKLSVVCESCQTQISTTHTSHKKQKFAFDINKQAVATSLATGSGRAGLAKFSELMNIPVMHHKTFNTHTKIIHKQSHVYKQKVLSDAHQVIREAYPEQSGEEIDIDVSYDGSWHTRGHKSKLGLGCVIENRTGLVVDYEVLSKYCHVCETVGAKIQEDDEKNGKNNYDNWLITHQPDCDKNHDGSSGSMEQICAVNMWKRSKQHGFRYKTVICDGDANTIKKINESNPYSDLVVEKRECINHVAKRLGTALRKVVDDKRKAKITLGGNGKGKLTQTKIGKLQKYYTRAIRSHSSVPEMKRAIWATFKHCSSTNDSPAHEDCPDGLESWCFYKKAVSKGLPPPNHDLHMGSHISPFVAKYIEHVYERLSDEELLSKCVEGLSQNVNESIHSLIWSRCPKHIFVGRKRLEVSVSVGVGEFNKGAQASQNFLEALGLTVGCLTKKFGEKRDQERKRQAEKAIETIAKKRREVRRLAQSREEERFVELEGGAQYKAGGF